MSSTPRYCRSEMKMNSQSKPAPAANGTPSVERRSAGIRNQRDNTMQIQSRTLGTQRPRHVQPAQSEPPTPKEITLKTLAQVKAKLYENAARSIELNPGKKDIIQKAVDRDAARFAFVINTIAIKL